MVSYLSKIVSCYCCELLSFADHELLSFADHELLSSADHELLSYTYLDCYLLFVMNCVFYPHDKV